MTVNKLNAYHEPVMDDEKIAIRQVELLIKESEVALDKAARLADKYRLTFDIDGQAYGMGGKYSPIQRNSIPVVAYRPDREYDKMEKDGVREHGWLASSQSC